MASKRRARRRGLPEHRGRTARERSALRAQRYVVAARRLGDVDLLDATAQWAVFAHQLGHQADAAAERDHRQDRLVAFDLRVDLGVRVVLLEPPIDAVAL